MPILGVVSSSALKVSNSYESISTITTTSGGGAVFTSIPQTYKHLQLRALIRGARASVNQDGCAMRFNNSTAGYHYIGGHAMYGTATSGNAQQTAGWIGTSTFGLAIGQVTQANISANNATLIIVDIPNYSSTVTTKNARSFSMYDTNGAQDQNAVFLQGMWANTAAITQIEVLPNSTGGFAANSVLALYGIKG